MDDCVVLLVDDEAGFSDVLARRLARRGHTVLSAPGAAAALDSLAVNSDVDVIVLDVQMPGMDGYAALSRMKRLRPHVEVILLTAFGSDQGAVRGLSLGAFDYLTKPCDLGRLLATIEAAARSKRGQEGKVCQAKAALLRLKAEHGDAPWPDADAADATRSGPDDPDH